MKNKSQLTDKTTYLHLIKNAVIKILTLKLPKIKNDILKMVGNSFVEAPAFQCD